jgi:hypothetical protein
MAHTPGSGGGAARNSPRLATTSQNAMITPERKALRSFIARADANPHFIIVIFICNGCHPPFLFKIAHMQKKGLGSLDADGRPT